MSIVLYFVAVLGALSAVALPAVACVGALRYVRREAQHWSPLQRRKATTGGIFTLAGTGGVLAVLIAAPWGSQTILFLLGGLFGGVVLLVPVIVLSSIHQNRRARSTQRRADPRAGDKRP